MRLGITIPFEPFNGTHFPELVRTADRCGYTDAWSYESFSTDGFAPIAAAAMLSGKMRFGCAIIPVFTRPAPLIAMSAVTTNELAGGRFILGLGISTPNIVEQWMGVPFRKPVTPMLDNTREAMRAAGKDPAGLDVVCRIICAVDEDEDIARTLFRRSLTAYV